MKITQKIVEQLTGSEMVDALVALMLEHIDGFQEDHNRYLSAIEQLREELGEAADKLVDTIYKRTALDLLFAGTQGLKMNWDHFANPVAPNCTWEQVDFHDYLREDIAHNLPDYRRLECILSDFYCSLTEAQKEQCQVLMEYDSYLVTVGPKIAHYYGYLLGNILMYQLVPGYREDTVLTFKYHAMLEAYFDKHFLPVEL